MHTCTACRRRYDCRCNDPVALYRDCGECADAALAPRLSPGDEIVAHALGVSL